MELRGYVLHKVELIGLCSGRRAEGSGMLTPHARKHQRVLQMSSTVPRIEENT